jgi:hypothetical protein
MPQSSLDVFGWSQAFEPLWAHALDKPVLAYAGLVPLCANCLVNRIDLPSTIAKT